MLPINFPEANIVLVKPEGWKDELCLPCPAEKGIDENGIHYHTVAFRPSKEDIEAIKLGGPVYLKVAGECFPPVALFTLDENGQPNYDQ